MTNEAYIRQHREEDVRQLALRKPADGIDQKWCLQQIEGWQIARRKLPLWAAVDGIWYPPRLSMEQCSSDDTAQYKRSLVERLIPDGKHLSMIDLTGGLGVDFSHLAPLFGQATYVEIQPELQQLAEHNMPLLMEKMRNGENERMSCPHIHFATPDDASLLTLHFSLIFLDPARRDGAGRKTVGIAGCTPNLLDIQDTLLSHALWVVVKLSPMLDITEALRQLHGVSEVHVVSVRGECKELLFVMHGSQMPFEGRPTIHCVNLRTDDDEIITPIGLQSSTFNLNPSPLAPYLYEPNASLLKAGVQDVLTERYAIRKLHPMSHLFVGDGLIPHFPGRRFRIVGWSDFSKKALKELIGDLNRANLAVRNFPTSVEKLRRQLRLTEGGNVYLFATTQADGTHILIKAIKAEE